MHLATIITESHLGYAMTVADSLAKHTNVACEVHCLVVDSATKLKGRDFDDKVAINFYTIDDVQNCPHFDTIFKKYAGTDEDAFRWSMKSVFVRYLLNTGESDSVAFVDPDQFFVGDPATLFEQMATSRFLLSPHDRPIDPAAGGLFYDQFTDGMFNGGLFVARKDAIDILNWWSSVCVHRCEKKASEGLFVDQKYLDAVLTNFPETDWIRHRGVNVASWNMTTRKRHIGPEGQILIDQDPLICVHFSGSTIRQIDGGADSELRQVLSEYRRQLKEFGINLPLSQTQPFEPQKDVVAGAPTSWLGRFRVRMGF